MSVIKHKGKEWTIPDGSTAEETLRALQGATPELQGAKLEPDGKSGNYRVKVSLGRKG